MAHKGQDHAKDEVSEGEEAAHEGEKRASSLIDKLGRFFEALRVKSDRSELPQSVLPELSVDGLVKYIQSDACKRVIAMVGAGMSTSAGIPDFRSPNTGIYSNLQQYDLPSPEAMFELSYFRQHPEPFFHLARDLLPSDDVRPTPSHMFLKLLSDKGLLQRVYTQNIDCLERVAGIPEEKIVEAHGSFHSATCLNPACQKKYSFQWVRSNLLSDRFAVPKCETCDAIVKPDIVFFGEALPGRFFELADRDYPECDLLIVIGTSLCVQPFASLLQLVPDHVPRLAINLTAFKRPPRLESLLGVSSNAFDFDSDSNQRDIFMQGRCDDMCMDLADRLGWTQELERLIKPNE